MPRSHPALALAAALGTIALAPATAHADAPRAVPTLDLEAGLVDAARNDVQIPGNSGTRFSLTEGSFGARSAAYFRIQAGLALGRHHLLVTAAPLRIRSSGRAGDTIVFHGQTFSPAGTDARYRFDTYRLTYRYAVWQGARTELQVGATGLVRDAEIRLSSGAISSSKKNLGVVPLLSLRAAWRVAGPFSLVVDGDALAAPQGRAEDVLIAAELDTGDVRFRVGYRIIEGGADNDTVYNFALLNHFGAGVTYQF